MDITHVLWCKVHKPRHPKVRALGVSKQTQTILSHLPYQRRHPRGRVNLQVTLSPSPSEAPLSRSGHRSLPSPAYTSLCLGTQAESFPPTSDLTTEKTTRVDHHWYTFLTNVDHSQSSYYKNYESLSVRNQRISLVAPVKKAKISGISDPFHSITHRMRKFMHYTEILHSCIHAVLCYIYLYIHPYLYIYIYMYRIPMNSQPKHA